MLYDLHITPANRMEKINRLLNLLVINFLVFLLGLEGASYGQIRNSQNEPILGYSGAVLLLGIIGRIDHMAFNSKEGLVYVAALGNNTVEVVDLRTKKVIHSILGLDEPQGIRYIPESNSLVVANGGNGECKVFDAQSYQLKKSILLGVDADNVRYDPISHKIFIGYGAGAIAVIDAVSLRLTSKIDLPGHPESFQFDSKNKLYVNVPEAHLIVVIDLNQEKIIYKWKIDEASSNFPMALDEYNHRLFIGCRRPYRLLILDSQTGKLISAQNADNDMDDIYYDSKSGVIFMSCGSGYIDTFRQVSPDKYEALAKVESSPGARTSLFIPELKQLIVAVPARSDQEARLLIYNKN